MCIYIYIYIYISIDQHTAAAAAVAAVACRCMLFYDYIYILWSIYIYILWSIYIYIERERVRERERNIYILLILYICIYIHTLIFKMFVNFSENGKPKFQNMFINRGNAIGSHKFTQNINLFYKTHRTHQITFPTVHFFQKYIFFKN